MDGSSESGWQRSDGSRGLNSSGVSDRNPRLIGADPTRFPGDTAHDGLSSVFEDGIGEAVGRAIECSDVSLRQWLDNPERAVDALECLHIFSQIVEIVNLAHSQGIVVHNVRPSCFVMSSFNRVSFIESASCSDSGSDSYEDVANSQTPEFKDPHELNRSESQLGIEDSQPEVNPRNTQQMVSETSCLQSNSDVHVSLEASNVDQAEEKEHPFPMKQILLMETAWYTSPEEVDGAPSSCASDIYRLGVLLFEVSFSDICWFECSKLV